MQRSNPPDRATTKPGFPHENWGAGLAGGSEPDAAATLCRTERRIAGRQRPRTEAELQALLATARRDHQQIYPISCGRNWGLGSHVPSTEGAMIIELSEWKKIGPLDRSTLSVRIEPGVTPGLLHAWLQEHAPDLTFNVTGSGTTTSVMGCALERGLGYTGATDRSIFGLEIMLADGRVFRPDPDWFHPARDHAAGPAHDALFFQSNYGIVLAARLRLRVRQEKEQAVIMNGPLPEMLAALVECYRTGLLTLPTHIAEPGRTGRLAANRLRQVRGRAVTASEVAKVFPESGHHVGLAALHGRASVVNACWRELRGTLTGGLTAWRIGATGARRLEKLARTLGLRNHADRLAAFLPLLGLTWGVPTDAGLQALDLPDGVTDPDQALTGAIYGNAVCAPTYAATSEIAGIVSAAWADSACTYIVMNAHCLVTVYTLHFTNAQTDGVKAAEQAIARQLRAAGHPPYRLGINLAGPGNGGLHQLIKSALDPAGIVAAGRYEAR